MMDSEKTRRIYEIRERLNNINFEEDNAKLRNAYSRDITFLLPEIKPPSISEERYKQLLPPSKNRCEYSDCIEPRSCFHYCEMHHMKICGPLHHHLPARELESSDNPFLCEHKWETDIPRLYLTILSPWHNHYKAVRLCSICRGLFASDEDNHNQNP